ncbi:MAG: prepilin-type N-terminal cleavage/methylation domain-containing protein [Gemmatimonadaceae bacterium]
MRTRGGFTLVELMVAVFLLGVGLAGLIATSSAISRMMGGSIRESTASTIAASRFERLRASACASIVTGSATTYGVTESWVVTKINARMFDVTDSLSYVPISRRSPVKQAYRSYVTC